MADNRPVPHTGGMERNRIVAIALGAAIVLSLVLLGVSALMEDPVSLDPDTPEGVVQSFVVAIAEERWVDARSLLDSELAEACEASDLSMARDQDISRVVIDGVSDTDGSVAVDVTIVHTSLDNPIDPSTWDEDVSFILTTEHDGWVIDELSWPYVPCRVENPW